jgi:hypothetical protein
MVDLQNIPFALAVAKNRRCRCGRVWIDREGYIQEGLECAEYEALMRGVRGCCLPPPTGLRFTD